MKSLQQFDPPVCAHSDGSASPGLFWADLHRRRRVIAPLCGWPAVRIGGDDGQDR